MMMMMVMLKMMSKKYISIYIKGCSANLHLHKFHIFESSEVWWSSFWSKDQGLKPLKIQQMCPNFYRLGPQMALQWGKLGAIQGSMMLLFEIQWRIFLLFWGIIKDKAAKVDFSKSTFSAFSIVKVVLDALTCVWTPSISKWFFLLSIFPRYTYIEIERPH